MFGKMKGNAIALTGGLLKGIHAKTTHGLIRGSDRFNLVAIVDREFAGQYTDEVLMGFQQRIPIYESVRDFVENCSEPALYCILGVATKGGIIPDAIKEQIKNALDEGLHIVNGLHTYISDIPEFQKIASKREVEIFDIRKPRPTHKLAFWSGEIKRINVPRIAVLGTDCAVGKRTTAWMLTQALRKDLVRAEMIYTGQTGWMMGAQHGFIFDSTLNDFVSGEIEKAICECVAAENPDVIFLEGQSSLRNPSGPCGSEFLVSGEAKYTILQHHAGRTKFNGFANLDNDLPGLKDEVALIRAYGSETIAVTLNASGLSSEEAMHYRNSYQKELGVPVFLPSIEGVHALCDIVKMLIRS